MTTALERQRHWLAQRLAADAPPPGAPDWLAELRAAGREALDRLPPIARRLEAWRYTDPDGLFKADLAPGPGATGSPLPAPAAGPRLVIHNGRFSPHASTLETLPAGVRTGGLAELVRADGERIRPWLGRIAAEPSHLLAALNTALIHDGAVIHIEAGTAVPDPIEIVFHYDAQTAQAAHPRCLICLGPGAQARVLERFSGAGSGLHNGITEVRLGAGARLIHHRILDGHTPRWQLDGIHLDLEQGADYQGLLLALGGSWSRNEYYARFAHPQTACTVQGLYTAGGRRLADVHLDLRHEAPGGVSRSRFKGLLHGTGRAVFDGRILVAPGAQHTDARLHNQNLMLAPGAEVDTKPQLEIYADDVQCAHGASIGQLDPSQLFYLRSRGIGEHTARRMLCRGFAAEILEGVEDDTLRGRATEAVEAALDQALSEPA